MNAPLLRAGAIAPCFSFVLESGAWLPLRDSWIGSIGQVISPELSPEVIASLARIGRTPGAQAPPVVAAAGVEQMQGRMMQVSDSHSNVKQTSDHPLRRFWGVE